jgi:hypothetical protein
VIVPECPRIDPWRDARGFVSPFYLGFRNAMKFFNKFLDPFGVHKLL